MSRLLRRIAVLAVVTEAVLFVAWRLHLLQPAACSERCGCSTGATACRCGHATCLAPVEP